MDATAIASRAFAQVGTPFRFRGRTPGIGLDCVGLALSTLEPSMRAGLLSFEYSMRGDFRSVLENCFAKLPFRRLEDDEGEMDGDILLVLAGPSQLHLMIAADGGWVHAHAGLRRIVFTPIWPNWPIIQRWRWIGE